MPACPLPLEALPKPLQKHADPSAPPQLRMMGAKGLVPAVAAGDLVVLLYTLSFDPDAAVRETAVRTAEGLPEKIWSTAVRAESLRGEVLDWLADRFADKDEALLREWPRLKDWIADDRDGLRRLRHISDAAASWQRLDREEGELYRGARLEQALAWQEEHPEDLSPLEVEFLAAGRRLRDAEQAAEQKRLQERDRQNRRLRIALAVVALALAAAVAGGIFALLQRGHARDAADRLKTGEATSPDQALRIWDEGMIGMSNAAAVGSLFSEVHPDEAVRTRGEAAVQDVQKLGTELQLDRDLYDVFAALDAAALDAQGARLLDKTLTDFRRAGVDRDVRDREKPSDHVPVWIELDA